MGGEPDVIECLVGFYGDYDELQHHGEGGGAIPIMIGDLPRCVAALLDVLEPDR